MSQHEIRHTTATHLLRAGGDINTIRAWLGHVSIDTTNNYAEVDLETKAKTPAACQSFAAKHGTSQTMARRCFAHGVSAATLTVRVPGDLV